ncbi:MAG TPA: hypothetical protein VMR54_02995 [Thermoanaerobaculia bacterium]|nr:hypothetical protein [Thermoanaerobaculia bacterium]
MVTQDAWTTAISLNLGRAGGVTTWAAGLTESNVLGLGKEVGFLFDEGAERTNRVIEYKDPALFASYWSAALLYSDNSDGSRRLVQVRRPFVSWVDPMSAQGLWDRAQLQDRIYADGVVLSEYSQRHEQALLSVGRALSPNSRWAHRVTAGINFFQDHFQPLEGQPEGALPAPRDFRYVFVGWEAVENNFVTRNYVNRGERLEDFNLGLRAAVEFGVSPKAFGAPATSFSVGAEAGAGWQLGPQAFVQAGAVFQTRLQEGGIQNGILTGRVVFVWKHSSSLLQTTVAQVLVDRGWNLDRDVQFFADGDHGLRGYHLYAFEGDRRILLNLEHRFFGGFEILQLFSLGAAVFVDSGAAVPPGEPLRFSSLRTDAGVGLRIGIARAASNTVLRLDCAYAFEPDPLGRRGWLVSFSSGQAF